MFLLTLLSLAQAQTPTQCLMAEHHGVWSADTVTWKSTAIIDQPEGVMTLATPLPPFAELLPQEGVEAQRDADGRVVALALTSQGGFAEFSVREPADRAALHPPLCAGELPQRVTLDGASFHPDASLGLLHHARSWAPPEQTPIDRARLDGRMGRRAGRPLYLTNDNRVRELGGLPGTLTPAGERSVAVAVAVASVFAAVIAALAGMWRALDRAARREQRAG